MNKTNAKRDLLYVYNPVQAKYMANNGAIIFRIGQGNQGDVCLTFEKTEDNMKIYNEWLNIQTPKQIK
jgi:hypothetical protein